MPWAGNRYLEEIGSKCYNPDTVVSKEYNLGCHHITQQIIIRWQQFL